MRTVSPPRTAVALDAATLAEYVGSYPLGPGFTLAVTRDGARLFVQATGQPRFEVHAEKRDAFSLTAVDAQLTFTRDAGGVVTGLVLHQNGASRPAPKRPWRPEAGRVGEAGATRDGPPDGRDNITS